MVHRLLSLADRASTRSFDHSFACLPGILWSFYHGMNSKHLPHQLLQQRNIIPLHTTCIERASLLVAMSAMAAGQGLDFQKIPELM